MSPTPRVRAVLQALLVTFLWSTSWVLIKRFLDEIPPLLFAGLRFTIAFVILLPGMWKHRRVVRRLPAADWGRLAALGLAAYTLTQGSQFLTLKYLRATTFSLILNFATILIALVGIVALREVPSRAQWAGIVAFLAGVLMYFLPLSAGGGTALGYALALFSMCANAGASLLGRSVNRQMTIPPLVVTVISMGVGAVFLLAIGLALHGFPRISLAGWAVILWLAVVNTAVAYTLWNKTLRILPAVESSIINNTMLVQIAVLAWVFLGERLAPLSVIGLAVAAAGVLIVQIRPDSAAD